MLTENGYHRPTYDEILESKIQTAKKVFGEDIETSEQTPLGKYIRINAYDLAKAYEDIEAVYYSSKPNSATGVSLDRICPFAGISRNPATQAQHLIRVYSTEGTDTETPIGIGELVVCGEDSDITFYSSNNYTLPPDGGSVEVVVECAEAGVIGNVTTITDIVNPIAEIDRIEYVRLVEVGENAESDIDLRKRFSVAIEGAGSTNANSIRAALMRIPTVKSANVIENNTDAPDGKGRPPRSFECFIYGGKDYINEIASAIFEKAPIGISTYGSNHMQVLDEGGYPHDIFFSFTENVAINISITFKKDAKFEADGEAQIKKILTDYINGLGAGTDVIKSSLYGHIYGVNGVIDVTAITMNADGKTPTSEGNIAIDEWEVAQIGEITLTEVKS